MVHTKEDPEDPRFVFCDRLLSFDVEAHPAECKEKYSGNIYEGSEWLIDVAEGPVRQVLIWDNYDPDIAFRRTNYLVPDSRIRRSGPRSCSLRSVRVRRFPVFGPVVRVRWREQVWGMTKKWALWAEVVNRLSQDDSVKNGIAKGRRDVIISVEAGHDQWVLTETWDDNNVFRMPKLVDSVARRLPSRPQWDCYQAIAECLLATPMPTDK